MHIDFCTLSLVFSCSSSFIACVTFICLKQLIPNKILEKFWIKKNWESLFNEWAPSGIHKYVNWLFILSKTFSVVKELLGGINDSKNNFDSSFFSNKFSLSGYVNSIIEPFLWLNETTAIYKIGFDI